MRLIKGFFKWIYKIFKPFIDEILITDIEKYKVPESFYAQFRTKEKYDIKKEMKKKAEKNKYLVNKAKQNIKNKNCVNSLSASIIRCSQFELIEYNMSKDYVIVAEVIEVIKFYVKVKRYVSINRFFSKGNIRTVDLYTNYKDPLYNLDDYFIWSSRLNVITFKHCTSYSSLKPGVKLYRRKNDQELGNFPFWTVDQFWEIKSSYWCDIRGEFVKEDLKKTPEGGVAKYW